MTWTMETSQGFESDKIAAFVVPYLQGKFLDLGCGVRPVWPTAIGIDSGGTFGPHTSGIKGDIADLSLFKDESLDGVFSSHALEDFPRSQVPDVLREWLRVLKIGGHLVLYVPSANLYPTMGKPGANPHHKWDIYPGDVEKILKEMTETGSKGARPGLTLLESEERGETNEYSLYIVVRKEAGGGWREKVWQRNPDGRKRCLLCRFGAIGDQILASSILPGLVAQGYAVTYMTTPQSAEIVRHDPNIYDWIIQATDYVPNQQLGPYWKTIATRYDKVVNLSESIEGALLALPDRLTHDYPIESRRRIMGTVNYHERTHDIAAVPHDFASKFYATEAEKVMAEKWIRECDGPVILWSLHGSSVHKVYPWTQVVVRWLMEKANAHVFVNGDPGQGAALQEALIHNLKNSGVNIDRQLHPVAGQWTIRETLAFAQQADVVVGPETGVLNAVALDNDVAKVIMMSHSSHENLTKHWKNTAVVLPNAERCPCYPCHRLHYGWAHCVKNESTQAAQCASSVAPEALFEAIMNRLGFVQLKPEAKGGLDQFDRDKEHARSNCTVDQ